MSSLKYAHGSGETQYSDNGNGSGNGKYTGGLEDKHHLVNKVKSLSTDHSPTKGQNGNGVHEHQTGLIGDCLSKVGNVVNPYTYEIVQQSADYILNRTTHRPKIGIICGSGLGALGELLENKDKFPYCEIPHFPESTVCGHAGQLVLGELANVPVLVMQGRFHFYEGYPLWKCSMPVRVFKLLGIEILIVTNAAGGLNKEYKVGDIMIIKDHLNFPGMGGDSALRGPNDDRFGPRFPPLNTAYDSKLRVLAKQVANELGMNKFVREGVYTMVGGPSYETVAELRAMRILGVDAVGMSTIPEVIAARHCGIQVFAFSLITNECITDYDVDVEASHEEVVETANNREEDLKRFVTQLIPSIHQIQNPSK
jgi:purine-nucleoside phosphorylase